MKKLTLVLMVAVVWPFTFTLHAQTEKEIGELFSLLQQERYVTLVNNVCAMRNKEYYKNAFMDYCLAYGYCQLGKRQTAAEWFDHLLDSYNSLSETKRKELTELSATCQNPDQVPASATDMISYLRTMNPEGFEGNQTGIDSKMGIPSLTDTVSDVDFEHATFDTYNRQFTQQQKSEACTYFQAILNDNSFYCDSTKHLLVFYSKNDLDIKNQIKELEEYYEYYSREYNLGESNRLITIFYCSGRSSFNSVAGKVHHLNVPGSTFGYASSADLVMLGIASAAWLGAMKHELFHLMIRSFVGDIPAWLDEGIASYYESSSLKDDHVKVNMRNYRTNIFHDLPTMRDESRDKLAVPTVEQFTNYNWQQYSGKTGDLMIKASLNYSISYVFVMFLNDKGKLLQVVDAFRNRTFQETQTAGNGGEALTILHVRPSNEILTGVMGMDMNQIQVAFEDWCKANPDLRVNPYKVE